MIGKDWIQSRDGDTVMNELRAWEQKVEGRYFKLVADEHPEVTKASINMGNMLNKMPKKVRDQLVREYESIIGLTHLSSMANADLISATDESAVNAGIGRILRVEEDRRSPMKLFIDEDMRNHPLGFILNRMTPQLDRETGQMYASANILRADYIDEVMNADPLEVGKKAMIFDTETAGILETSGVRQIGFLEQEIGKKIDIGDVEDLHFRTHQMQRGWIAGKGGVATANMQDVIEHGLRDQGKAFANLTPGSGEDFANALRPFLEKLQSADYVIGHNIQFDLDQIFQGLRLTSVYQENTDGFRTFLDDVTSATLGQGKIRDTLIMAQHQLGPVELDPTLRRLGSASTHSIENLLLQTNLFDLVKQDIAGHLTDPKAIEALVTEKLGLSGGSLHSADIDTYVTSVLNESLRAETLSATGSLGSTGVDALMRSSIYRSRALTPITKIANVDHLDRSIFGRMLETGRGIDFAEDGLDIGMLQKMGADQAYDFLSQNNVAAIFDITPLEQQMYLTRGDITTNVAKLNRWEQVFDFGRYREFSGVQATGEGWLNRAMTLFKRGIQPSTGEYSDFQAQMREAGMPFADISEPERMFTHAISLSAGDAPADNQLLRTLETFAPTERKILNATDDLGISRFFHYEHGFMTRSGRNINLHMGLLQDAGVLSDETMFDYSAFKMADGEKMFNLQFKMTEDQALDVAAYIESNKEEVAKYFTDDANIDDIIEALPTVGSERGVGVGFLRGRAATRAYDMVESFNIGNYQNRRMGIR
jgi:hypothetical protein